MSFSNFSSISKSFFKYAVLLCLYLSLSSKEKNFVVAVVATVQTVPAGNLAELPCLSIDDDHNFMFWQLKDDKEIIGPRNLHDEEKYNYEVLTGKLFIRGVSTTESGFYKCFSRGILDPSAINVHTIELIVTKDWEEDYANNYEVNILRAIAAGMVVILVIIVIFLIVIIKRKRTDRFTDLEESREPSPDNYDSNITSVPIPPTIPKIQVPVREDIQGIDNMGLEVDFPKVFKNMQISNALP